MNGGTCLGEQRVKRVSLTWAHWEMWPGMSLLPQPCAPRKHELGPRGPVLAHFLAPPRRPKLSSQAEGGVGVVGETQITGWFPVWSSFVGELKAREQTDNKRTRNPWKRRGRVGLRVCENKPKGKIRFCYPFNLLTLSKRNNWIKLAEGTFLEEQGMNRLPRWCLW